METQMLSVQGMECAACVRAVTQALLGLDGVETAEVNLEREEASVRFDPAKLALPQLIAVIAEEGYTAAPKD
jgi:Cu+-exporting ATPase